METYFELNDEERNDLRSKLSIIFKSYKKYCNLIDNNIEGCNVTEIIDTIYELKPLIENNLEKIIYNGLEFLFICMSKIIDTDIRYSIDFLSYFFNEKIYKIIISQLISKKERNEYIEKSERRYYYYFIYAEIIKCEWLKTNYEDLSILPITKYSLEEIQCMSNINRYIDENIDKSIKLINYLYDNIKHNFPEWETDIAQCKDINFSFGNPINLYFNGIEYIKN
jgi:hypothetical protein